MKKEIKEKSRKKVVILGEEINPDTMPVLYGRVLANPEWVKKAVRGIMKAQSFDEPGSVMAILESDLS